MSERLTHVEVSNIRFRCILATLSLGVCAVVIALSTSGSRLALGYLGLPAFFSLVWNVFLFEHPIWRRQKLREIALGRQLAMDGILVVVTIGFAVTFQVKNNNEGDVNLFMVAPICAYILAVGTFLVFAADGWGWIQNTGRD